MSQTSLTSFYSTRKRRLGSKQIKENIKTEQSPSLNVTYELDASTLPLSQVPILRTPKRTLSEPEEPLLDSKKKKTQSLTTVDVSPPSTSAVNTKKTTKTTHPAARKRLDLGAQPVPKENLDQETKPAASDKNPKLLSSGIDDLKERLQKFDKTFQKLRDFQTNKCKITSVISTESTSKKTLSEPEKKETVPCYEKYSYLSVAGSPSLILPYKYGLLLDMFRSSDMIVSMLHNRKERCTFEKLKSGVQDMSKKTFTKNNLGQIRTVFPTAYSYEIEKNPPSVINRKPGTPLYQLIITPILNNDSDSTEGAVKSVGKSKADLNSMTPSCLVERKDLFRLRLLNIVRQHHQAFLSKLNPPIIIPPEKITKWHPRFRLDSVPDIEVAPLPEPPNVQKIDSAKDVLNKLRGKASERIERALEKVVKMNAENEQEKKIGKQDVKVTKGALKGLSLDLLQRIRAKENAKIAEEMTVNVADQERAEMLERVPELVNILRTYFITERKAAMSMEDTAQRLSDSYHTALPPAEVEKHVHLMSKIFPRWLTLISIRNNMYVKIDKNMDINVMLNNMPKK